MKRWHSIPIAAMVSLCFLQAAAGAPRLYPLDDGTLASQPQAQVRMQRGFSGPAMLLVSFDGKDPRSFPSMAEYAEKVRKAETTSKPGLVSASPGRNEPELIGVAPGVHTYGALFIVIDIARGLLGNQIAHALAAKYLPEGSLSPDDHFITAKHYEELTFSAQAGKRYLIGYAWDKQAVAVAFTVGECSESWKDCSPVPVQTANAQTTVKPGVGAPDIEKQ